MQRFEEKVVFITGASSGLGAACATLFTAQGAKVFGVARDTAKLSALKESIDGEFNFACFDLSEANQCEAAIYQCIEHYGQLDVLVNIAGKHTFRHTAEMNENDWQEDLAINLSGPFFLSRAALPHLLERKGNIVNVASIAGLQGQPYSAGYCAAKHGLIGLTKAMAMEFMKSDLRVNVVCPGGMDTPQVQNIQPPEDCDFELLMKSAATRGFMQANECASVIAFLASDDASAIHGAVYTVDQGKTVG